MLKYDGIDISEGIDINKTNESREWKIMNKFDLIGKTGNIAMIKIIIKIKIKIKMRMKMSMRMKMRMRMRMRIINKIFIFWPKYKNELLLI